MIVVLNEQMMERPMSREDTINMLLNLSGNTHEVMTAVNMRFREQSETLINITSVTFRHISEMEAEHYWETGEPRDKAGGYGIQGIGGMFVKEIHGLPLYETHQLLSQFGIEVLSP